MLEKNNIKRVSPIDFLKENFKYPVFTQLDVKDMLKETMENLL